MNDFIVHGTVTGGTETITAVSPFGMESFGHDYVDFPQIDNARHAGGITIRAGFSEGRAL